MVKLVDLKYFFWIFKNIFFYLLFSEISDQRIRISWISQNLHVTIIFVDSKCNQLLWFDRFYPIDGGFLFTLYKKFAPKNKMIIFVWISKFQKFTRYWLEFFGMKQNWKNHKIKNEINNWFKQSTQEKWNNFFVSSKFKISKKSSIFNHQKIRMFSRSNQFRLNTNN